ncbi:MAG: metallopeptidase TldD-related protein [Gemmatimonadota bacterium]
MIAALLSDAAPRADAADAVAKTDETITLTVDPAGGGRSVSSVSGGAQIRVFKDGRIGWRGESGTASAALIDGALASAAAGEPVTVFLPAPAPVAEVATRDLGTTRASIPELWEMVRSLAGRLAGPEREVEAWLERSSGTVALGNSRGVRAEYPVSLAGVGARVRTPNAPPVDVHVAGGALPTSLDLEQLALEVDRRLSGPALEAEEIGSCPVLFRPRAVRALLRPILAALTGDPGPIEPSLAVDLDLVRLDRRLTLIDDPLAPLRPGSRPIDDDGVPSLRLTLIDRGRVRTGLTDLLVGARLDRPSTGHAWRSVLGAPRVGATNLRLLPDEGASDPLAAIDRGVLVEDLTWNAAPNAATGSFTLSAPWAYRIERGEVVGRLESVVLAGNAFEILGKVIAIGGDATWLGAACLPSVAVEGVRVSAAAR